VQPIGELAFLPQPTGLIDELVELRCNVPEASGSAEGDAVGPLEIIERRYRLILDLRAVPAQCWFSEISSSEAISSTWRTRTSAPSFSAPSATAWASRWTLPVAL
jgi:hypothetical protein